MMTTRAPEPCLSMFRVPPFNPSVKPEMYFPVWIKFLWCRGAVAATASRSREAPEEALMSGKPAPPRRSGAVFQAKRRVAGGGVFARVIAEGGRLVGCA